VFPIVLMALGAGAVPVLAADADNDGMDDAYEAFFGLNVATNDAALDPDGDGLSNLAESLLWTDPFAADTDRDGFADNADSNAVSRAWVPWGCPRFTAGNDVAYVWPAWMIAAFRSGGDWRTNPAAWHVAADETNGAALNLEVDRQLLTNDLALRMGYVDHSNATLYVELYDTNNAVVASNLFDNILSGSGADTNRVLNIPLESHANAVGIRLRRGSGEATVFDTLLYVDKDGDGLDADQERQLGTSDNDADSDHDGFTDFEEVFLFGTDPASAASVPFGSLLGQVAYSGVMTGTIHMVAAPAQGAWTSAWSSVLSAPGAYALDAPRRQTYYVKAYRDVNGNGVKDYWEPCGTALPLSVYLETASTNGVDVALGDPDSDGDGMSDAVELALGLDPFVPNAFARLPFVENFETNMVQVGELDSQNGWQAGPSGLALVQTGLVWEGSQALRINSYGASAGVRQLFAPTNAPVVWADARTMAWAGGAPTNPAWGSANAYLDDDGYLRVYDGLAASTNKWLVLTNLPPRAMTGEWVRLTVKLDYATQRWLACLDGVLARGNLGFATPVAQFNVMSVEGKRAAVDAICVGTNQPAGLSLDGDNLPDEWELAYFGNLDQVDAGDPDNDKLTNLQEYRLGTDPLVADADTDNDGLPDALEIALGTNPLVPDAGADPDNDGLTNLQESQLDTNPLNPDTDGDGMPDGWEVAHGLNPLFNDAAKDPDCDGLPNLQEYLQGTDPHNPDTDGDGLTDGDEVTNRLTSPTKADTDGDGIPDKWELDHGLNALVNDAALDPDHDGLSNLQEYLHGADPHSPDPDGDGVSDYEEALAFSDPLVADFDGTVTTINEVAGSSATNLVGSWTPVGEEIRSTGLRGELTYMLQVPSSGVYRVEVIGGGLRGDKTRLIANVDGNFAGVNNLALSSAMDQKVHFFTPWLEPGCHQFKLTWDNFWPGIELRIRGVRLQVLGGPDSDGNGRADWVDHYLACVATLDAKVTSLTSPYCAEGRARILESLSLNVAAQPYRGGSDRWFANIPLSETNSTTVIAGFFNGVVTRTNHVAWAPFNLLTTANLSIRAGDALRLTARPDEEATGSVSLDIAGVTNYTSTASVPVTHRFAQAGAYTITGVFSNGTQVIQRSVVVTVISASLPAQHPAVWEGRKRSWACPNLPSNQGVVEGDANFTVTRTGGGGSTLELLANDIEESHAVVVRVSPGGPILDARPIDGFWVVANVQGYYPVVELVADSSLIVRNTLVARKLPSTVVLTCQFIVGGCTFDNGTTTMTVTEDDLDEDGALPYYLVRSPGGYAVCHSIMGRQDSVNVGQR
jgi:hypothetical protein